jgi:transposase
MAGVKGRGRISLAPVQLTDDLIEEVADLLLDGNYIETACQVVGLSKKRFYQYMTEGKQAEEKKWLGEKLNSYERRTLIFRNAVRSSMAEAEARDLRQIRLAGTRDWKALAWRLERRAPKRWGKRADVTSGGEPLKGGWTLAELREFLAEEEGEGSDG